MNIKRGDIRKLNEAAKSMNQDMIPQTRYKLKRDKEKLESEYKQYQNDNDQLVEKYGWLEAPIIQKIDEEYIEVGTAKRIFDEGNVKWKSEEKTIQLDQLDLRRVRFSSESEVKEKAYSNELKEMDETEIDIDMKLIKMSELKRYNENGEKVNINLPAAADALLGVIIVEDEKE